MSKKILIFTEFYLPGSLGGGPIRSITNIVNALGSDFDFYIITRDRDLGDSSPYPNITPGVWAHVGKAKVMYVQKNIMFAWTVLKIFKGYDFNLIYLNSFFSPYFSIIPIFLNKLIFFKSLPILLAPRGEFSLGAINIKKIKKRIFIRFSKIIGMHKSITWHASTTFEKKDIERIFKDNKLISARIISASDIAAIESVSSYSKSMNNTELKICFISRISRKKNLDYALSVLQKSSISAVFSIYGPVEDEVFWQECESLINNMPPNIKVRYLGPIAPELVVQTLSGYDLFFFPTHGENFGHVIIEALASGLPVLLSDQTPWRQLREKNIGWDINLADPDAFNAALSDVSQWSENKWSQVKETCINYAKSIIYDEKIIHENKELFSKSMIK